MNKGEPHLREADDIGQERPVVPATLSHFHSDNSRVLTPIVSSSHTVKKIWVTSTIFWSSQLHACYVRDTLQNLKTMLPI